MIYILVAAACFLLWLFPGVRCALTHPFHCIYYGVKDGYNYIRYIFGARLAGTEVKRGWRFSPCSKYYPGGVEICGAEKILPDLYFCDGQAIMSMKLTEGST